MNEYSMEQIVYPLSDQQELHLIFQLWNLKYHLDNVDHLNENLQDLQV